MLKSRDINPVRALIDEDIVPTSPLEVKLNPITSPLALQVTPVQDDVAPEQGKDVATTTPRLPPPQSHPANAPAVPGQLDIPCLSPQRPFASVFKI